MLNKLGKLAHKTSIGCPLISALYQGSRVITVRLMSVSVIAVPVWMKAFALSALGRHFMAQSPCFLLDTTPGMLLASSASVHQDFQVSADSHSYLNFWITLYLLSVILYKSRIKISCWFLFRREGCVSATHISISGHFLI